MSGWPDWTDRPDGGHMRTLTLSHRARLIASVSFLDGGIVWHVRHERQMGETAHVSVLDGGASKSAKKAQAKCDQVLSKHFGRLRRERKLDKKRDAPLRALYERNSTPPPEPTP